MIELPVDSGGTIGSLKKKYYYANAQILAQDIDDSQSGFDKYFYLHDRLGSVRMVIDDTATVKNRYTYNQFGEDITSECTETVASPWKFTGQWYDAEISQYHLRARQYDPHIARFTGRDPVTGSFGEPATLHAYLYCLNDPIDRTDLSGELSANQVLSAIGIGMQIIGAADIGWNIGSAISGQLAWRNLGMQLAIDAALIYCGAKAAKLFGRGLKMLRRSTNVKKIVKNPGKKYKYAERIARRIKEAPRSHNFPSVFDGDILSTKPVTVRGGNKGFAMRGYRTDSKVELKEVVYNIIVEGDEIVHRDVVDVKEWARRSKSFGWPVDLGDIPWIVE